MSRIIDLTLTLRPGMRGVNYESSHTLERDGWNARMLHLYSHCGTHMDAPKHYLADGATIDAISLERCICPAWIANLREVVPRQLIEVTHLGILAEKIAPRDGLVLNTGWSAQIDKPGYRTEAPRVSLQLARWCVERRVALLGVEAPALADVNNIEELSAVHRLLLEAGVIIVEGLANLDAIAQDKVLFIAAPLKIFQGDGSPVRAFAVEGWLEKGC